MADAQYLLGVPAPPSAAKRWFDQRLIPVVIDGLGMAEAGLERVAQAARRRPRTAMAIAVGVGVVVGVRVVGGRAD